MERPRPHLKAKAHLAAESALDDALANALANGDFEAARPHIENAPFKALGVCLAGVLASLFYILVAPVFNAISMALPIVAIFYIVRALVLAPLWLISFPLSLLSVWKMPIFSSNAVYSLVLTYNNQNKRSVAVCVVYIQRYDVCKQVISHDQVVLSNYAIRPNVDANM